MLIQSKANNEKELESLKDIKRLTILTDRNRSYKSSRTFQEFLLDQKKKQEIHENHLKTNENLNIISPNQYPYKIKRNIFHNLSIKNMSNNITSLNHNNNILDSKSMHNLNNLSNLNNLNNLSKSNIYKKSIILKSSMSMVKPYYELISFSCEPREVTDPILKEIESEKKYFDYNLNREHAFLYDNCLIKDISLIGRDISKIIVIDDDENSFKLNKNNGIKITPFNQESKNDNVLFELKKILILIYKKNYDDVRVGLKEFSNDIKNKVNLIE